MAIIKFAEAVISATHQVSKPDVDFIDLLKDTKLAKIDDEVHERFVKFANNLKHVAPKANDFLYFSAVMLHASEANLIDQKTGELLKDKDGKPITAEWKINEKTGSWKWVCSDPNLKPYKNNNGDIFPESELKKAYRKWVGRPLCKDHQSSSVDGVRGIIVDTYYDDKFKRVIGLCALDKINYADLARKVETGYATNVSMGTAVGRSICFNCGNVARVEKDYCGCIRNRNAYGEINVDLSPIELSLVVTGADPLAKLRNVIASLNQYSDEKNDRIEELKKAGCVTPIELERLEKEIIALKASLESVANISIKKEAVSIEQIDAASKLDKLIESETDDSKKDRLKEMKYDVLGLKEEVTAPYGMSSGSKEMSSGGSGIESTDYDSEGPASYTFENRQNLNTLANNELASEIKNINNKLGAMEVALRDLSAGAQKTENYKEESIMSNSKLIERARARRAMLSKEAYFQGGGGVNDPESLPYAVDPMNDKLKTDGDKQMEGQGMESGVDGLHPGYKSYGNELELKKKLSRAEQLRQEALMVLAAAEWSEVGNTPDNKKVLYNSGTKETKVMEADDAKEFMKKKKAKKQEKKAYFQGGGGVNDPKSLPYAVDPMNDKLKTDGDKHMEGQGMESGVDGLHPGYKSYGDELSLKKKMLRADDQKLRAKFVLAFKDSGHNTVDKDNSYWEVYHGPNKILTASGGEVFEDVLEENWENFASKAYGREVLRAIRTDGFKRVAYLLKGPAFLKTAQPPMDLGMALPPAPAAPGAAPGMGQMPAAPMPMDSGEGKEDENLDANPTDTALESLSEHLKEAEKALGDLKKSLSDAAGESETELPSATASLEESEAASELVSHIKEIYAALDESADELAMLSEAIENRASDKSVVSELLSLAESAIDENEELCAEAALVVEAAKKKSKKVKKEDDEEEKKPKAKAKKVEEDDEEEEEKKDKKKKSKAEVMLENILQARADRRREMIEKIAEAEEEELEENDELQEEIDELRKEVDALKAMEAGEPEHEDEKWLVGEADDETDELGLEADDDMDEELEDLLSEVDDEEVVTAEDRRAWRAKVAAEVNSKYMLSLSPAVTSDTDMPLGGSHSLSGVKATGDGAMFEGLTEQHEKVMQQVRSVPNVREAVEHLAKLIKAGALDESDLDNADKLKALAVDPAAAKYWKEYFGQADKESSEFASELTKEYSKKKVEASLEENKLKLRRAYDLALEMQEKSMIPDGPEYLHKQVDEIMNFDTKAFESVKRALARISIPKTAKVASLPAIEVGVQGDDEMKATASPTCLSDQLRKLWG